MYDNGEGVPEDDRQAASWYRKAAEQGNASAQNNLGVMYGSGEGVPEDDRQAVFWYRKAAEQGDASAQYNLGLRYHNGEGVPEDDRQAAFWFRQAAEQGNDSAQYNLGLMYDNGEGVPEDDRQAAFWYRKAAEQGNDNAQYNLGLMYDNGEGVPEDDRQAAFWYRKAAEQGNASAQNNLGRMYFNGEGVLEDDVRAYAWLNLAAAQGGETAKQNRTILRRRMTPAQVAEAQKLSHEFAARIARGSGASAQAPDIKAPARPPGPSRNTVRQAQAHLATLGYDPGPADGVPGKRTFAAVRRFQKNLGMAPTGQISAALLRRLQAAVAARRETPGKPAIESSGSGFLVDSTGAIVTNHHVIEGCGKVTVNLAGQALDAAVQAQDAVNDLALLKTPRAAGKAATFSQSPRASLGAAVTVAGYPLQGTLAQSLNVTGGNISALAGLGGNAGLLQITAPVQQGNSGGPLLDAAGNVVGVIVSQLNALRAAIATGDIPQNVNFAIKGAVVRSFLDIHGVAYRRRDSDDQRTPAEVAERARDFTVAVHCWK